MQRAAAGSGMAGHASYGGAWWGRAPRYMYGTCSERGRGRVRCVMAHGGVREPPGGAGGGRGRLQSFVPGSILGLR